MTARRLAGRKLAVARAYRTGDLSRAAVGRLKDNSRLPIIPRAHSECLDDAILGLERGFDLATSLLFSIPIILENSELPDIHIQSHSDLS